MSANEVLAHSSTKELCSQLQQTDWFSQIGYPVTLDVNIQVIDSWEEASSWCEKEVSWWCNVEGKKKLYGRLASDHNDVFSKWNDVARVCLKYAVELIDAAIKPKIPNACFSNDVHDWIQSQIISALMECYYSEYVDVKLFREQTKYYTLGHFPCGWYVSSPNSFPEKSKIIVL